MMTYTSRQIAEFVSRPRIEEAALLKRDSTFPRISIVTPSFNQARFLERTILSVLNQNYPNLEYIIVDGGSTDGSVEIIRRYEKFLAFWVSEKDRGQGDGLNKGFGRASGEILAWLNSDDLYIPGALHKVARWFSEESRADVVYGNLYRIDSDDRIIEETRLTPFIARGYLYGGCDLPQPSSYWRRRIWDAVGGVDPEFVYHVDTDLFFRFVLAGGRFVFLREFLACFRLHPASKTSTIWHVRREDALKIRTKYLPRPYDSIYGGSIRAGTKLLRVLRYSAQGDFAWVARRIKERVAGHI